MSEEIDTLLSAFCLSDPYGQRAQSLVKEGLAEFEKVRPSSNFLFEDGVDVFKNGVLFYSFSFEEGCCKVSGQIFIPRESWTMKTAAEIPPETLAKLGESFQMLTDYKSQKAA